jgi:hypothetical protein
LHFFKKIEKVRPQSSFTPTPRLSILSNRDAKSVQHSLEVDCRTIAAITSGMGFVGGAEAGCVIGSLVAGFASDSSRIPHKLLGAGVIGSGFCCGVIGAATCYLGGIAATNLVLQAFPSLKTKKIPLLVANRQASAIVFICCASALGGRRLHKLGFFSSFR